MKKGFTLIELLIVIAVLAILATAVLSAINPIEQMRKARDAGRKSDAAELLNAYERYYTTFGEYPWYADGATALAAGGDNPDFTAGTGNSAGLVSANELKSQFEDRATVTDNLLFVAEDANEETVTVCFEPESETGRLGGMGTLTDSEGGAGASVVTCADSAYLGTDAAVCWICLPQ